MLWGETAVCSTSLCTFDRVRVDARADGGAASAAAGSAPTDRTARLRAAMLARAAAVGGGRRDGDDDNDNGSGNDGDGSDRGGGDGAPPLLLLGLGGGAMRQLPQSITAQTRRGREYLGTGAENLRGMQATITRASREKARSRSG